MLLRAFCVAFLALPAARAVERVVQRDFAVAAGSRVTLRTYRGSIAVQAGAPGKIHVEVRMQTESDSERDADTAVARLHLDLVQDGSAVTVAARNPADTRARFVWEEKYKLGLAYVLTVPDDCTLDLTSDDGGITVADLAGSVTAHGHKGVIYLKHIGGNVDATNDEGTIVLSRCLGSARLINRMGDVRAGAVGGRLEVSTVNGDIDVQRANGAVKAYVNAGDITLGLPKDVGTPIDISSNGGGITLHLDPAARCTLHASSVWGHVLAKLPLTIRAGGNNRRSLEADCNGGGPVVTLHANGGHVDIRPAPI